MVNARHCSALAMLHRSSPTQPKEVLSHWYVIVEAIQFSTQEFYAAVEAELAARQMPQLKISRVEYHEGSVLSEKRLYLRLARERLAFDVCAAPFGRDFFFSLRLVETPRGGWIDLLARMLLLFVILAALTFLVIVMLDPYWGIVIGLAIMLGGAWLFDKSRGGKPRSPGRPDAALFMGEMPDFDSFILNMPVIGAWYEARRKLTYYRHDTRLLYHTIVSGVVKTLVESITATKGVKLLRSYDYNPILGDLYKPVEKKLSSTPTAE